jgi:hypothetical protein
MFVMVINREMSSHVGYMEVHKIYVKKFVRELQGRRPLKRTRYRGDGDTAGPLHTMPV